MIPHRTRLADGNGIGLIVLACLSIHPVHAGSQHGLSLEFQPQRAVVHKQLAVETRRVMEVVLRRSPRLISGPAGKQKNNLPIGRFHLNPGSVGILCHSETSAHESK